MGDGEMGARYTEVRRHQTLAMLASLRPLARAADATSARHAPARASAAASADAMCRRSRMRHWQRVSETSCTTDAQQAGSPAISLYCTSG